jgi:inhibitor of cysteine peptidase
MMPKVEREDFCTHNSANMKFAVRAVAVLSFTLAMPAGEAAEDTNAPPPSAADTIRGETPVPEDHAHQTSQTPRMSGEVNLAETPGPESFAIEPPADEPDAETAAQVTEPLQGEEPESPRPPVTGTVEVTAKDENRTVRADLGNLIRITLESNPSTGYNWELRDFDYGVAEYHSSDLVARQSGGNVLFGAPGDTVITLQAVHPGTQNINLVYRRQWEPPDQIAAAFGFTLEVAGDAPATEASPTP